MLQFWMKDARRHIFLSFPLGMMEGGLAFFDHLRHVVHELYVLSVVIFISGRRMSPVFLFLQHHFWDATHTIIETLEATSYQTLRIWYIR